MLISETIAVNRVQPNDRLRMLQLMRSYYENVDADQFRLDLEKKDCVIVLRNHGSICGFSTQVLVRKRVSGREVNVLFSGDTVIEERFRNSLSLPVSWGRMMLGILSEQPTVPLFWLLISKGYKTYRYLPVFFRDYFPRPGRALSVFEHEVLDVFTGDLFNGTLDRDDWILRSTRSSQRLRAGVADITETNRQKPEIAFFEAVNPGHANGDELICLTQFTMENLNPFILRKLLKR